jgi:hypothetical protein
VQHGICGKQIDVHDGWHLIHTSTALGLSQCQQSVSTCAKSFHQRRVHRDEVDGQRHNAALDEVWSGPSRGEGPKHVELLTAPLDPDLRFRISSSRTTPGSANGRTVHQGPSRVHGATIIDRQTRRAYYVCPVRHSLAQIQDRQRRRCSQASPRPRTTNVCSCLFVDSQLSEGNGGNGGEHLAIYQAKCFCESSPANQRPLQRAQVPTHTEITWSQCAASGWGRWGGCSLSDFSHCGFYRLFRRY